MNFRTMNPKILGENLDLSIKNQGMDFEDLENLLASIKAHSITTDSPYFMNQLFTGVLEETKLAESLISETKTTLATFEAAPVFTLIEQELINKLGSIIGWSQRQSDGVVVPGGSAANFMALHCARYKFNSHLKKTGLRNSKQFAIYTSKEGHYSLKKACQVLGFGEDALVPIETDYTGSLIVEDLESKILSSIRQGITPLMVNATAGTTVLGAFDPIRNITKIKEKHNIWVHVDAAWGGPALFSKKARSLVDGIEFADSVSFDAHKLYGAGLTCSFFLTQHLNLLFDANDVSGADYLFHSSEELLDLGKKSWQCGRRPDAVNFWVIWKRLGTEGLASYVDRLLSVRDESVEWIKSQPRLELVAEPQYLNIGVRILPPESQLSKSDWSKYVREQLKAKNIAFVNFSSDSKGSFLRLILAHHQLQTSHIQEILKAALEVRS